MFFLPSLLSPAAGREPPANKKDEGRRGACPAARLLQRDAHFPVDPFHAPPRGSLPRGPRESSVPHHRALRKAGSMVQTTRSPVTKVSLRNASVREPYNPFAILVSPYNEHDISSFPNFQPPLSFSLSLLSLSFFFICHFPAIRNDGIRLIKGLFLFLLLEGEREKERKTVAVFFIMR